MSDPESGQWMTKAELAAARGISLASAERLVRRRKWRRLKGNDGRVRVLVPSVSAADISSDTTKDKTEDISSDTKQAEALIAALRQRIAALEGQLLGQSEALTAVHEREIARLREIHQEEINFLLGLVRRRRWGFWRRLLGR